MKLMPLSIALRMMRILNSSSMDLKPRCQPPRPINETSIPVRPRRRFGISEFVLMDMIRRIVLDNKQKGGVLVCQHSLRFSAVLSDSAVKEPPKHINCGVAEDRGGTQKKLRHHKQRAAHDRAALMLVKLSETLLLGTRVSLRGLVLLEVVLNETLLLAVTKP